MVIMEKCTSSNYPRCDEPQEDLYHVLMKLSLNANEVKNNLLRSNQTRPYICYAICIGIKSWFEDPSSSWNVSIITFTNDDNVNQTISSHIAFGWSNILCGVVSSDITRV